MEKELTTALIAASATLLGGVVTLVATQCIVKLIDPIFNLKKLIGEIAADLDFYGNVAGQNGRKGSVLGGMGLLAGLCGSMEAETGVGIGLLAGATGKGP